MENIETTQNYSDRVFESVNLSNNDIHPAKSIEQPCPTCSGSKNVRDIQYIYAIGRIQPRFSSVSLEKEFAQATSRTDTSELSDSQTMYEILSDPQNRYIARKLCWVLTIEGLETYILQPMNPEDLAMLIESLRPTPRKTDINIVIGVLGPIAPSNYCNGLQIPIVGFDQIYSFDVDSLLKSIPKPDKVKDKTFESVAEELFTKIMQMTDNAGATDDHRVLNYLAVRYHAIYARAADCYSRNCSLTGVEVRPSVLSGIRKVVEVIFTFNNRTTDVGEKYYCRVDVTEEFPFLVTKMQSYIDR